MDWFDKKMDMDAQAWWDQIHERDGVDSPSPTTMRVAVEIVLATSAVLVLMVIMYLVSVTLFDAVGDPHAAMWGFVLIVAGIAFYFLPTIIASKRDVDKTTQGMIFLVNFLVGWTLIGWLVCVLWAGLATPRPA